MKLSIVTGTRNRPASFLRLVNSIIHNTDDVEWELVVSDASEPPLIAWLPSNVRVIEERPRLGCTAGYNIAFRAALGEYVLWLNDDCEVLPGYAENAISFMERHPDIGLGALYYREGAKDFHVNTAWGVLYANFGILRRELGEQVGWFDDSLEMYGNDNSLTFRVLLAGKGVAGIPDARIIHHSEQDAERRSNEQSRRTSSDILRRKYGPYLPAMRATQERLSGLITA